MILNSLFILVPVCICTTTVPKPKFIFTYDLNNHTDDEDIKQILNLTKQTINQYKTRLIEKGNYPGITIEGFTGKPSETPRQFCTDEKKSFKLPTLIDFNGNAQNNTTALESMRERLESMSTTKYSFVIQVSVSTFQFTSKPPKSLMVDQDKKANFSSVLVVSQLDTRRSARSIPSGNVVFNFKDPAVANHLPTKLNDYFEAEMTRLSRGAISISMSTTTSQSTGLTTTTPASKYTDLLDEIEAKLRRSDQALASSCTLCCWAVVGISVVALVLAITVICLLCCCHNEYEERMVTHEGIQTTERHLDFDPKVFDEPSQDRSQPKITKKSKTVVIVTEAVEPLEEDEEPEEDMQEPQQQHPDEQMDGLDANVKANEGQSESKSKASKSVAKDVLPKEKTSKIANENAKHYKSAAQNMSEPRDQGVEIGVSENTIGTGSQQSKQHTKNENPKSGGIKKKEEMIENKQMVKRNNEYDQISLPKEDDQAKLSPPEPPQPPQGKENGEVYEVVTRTKSLNQLN